MKKIITSGGPKGHMEEGKSEIETAQRETKEEVGLDVFVDKKKRYTLNYVIRDRIDKKTVLYVATPKNEDIKMQVSEIEKIKWCDFDEALNILAFDNWKELFQRVLNDIDSK